MFALYIHIPFCLSKCRYCAFNSQPLPAVGDGRGAAAALIRDYLDALSREMRLAARSQTSEVRSQTSEKDVRRQTSEKKGVGHTSANHSPTTAAAPWARRPTTEREELSSVYVGGGTPTVLDPSSLCSILSSSKSCFNWDDSIEVTVEANPATVDRPMLLALRRGGVNRLSLGAQSFSAPELQMLGRPHGADDIYAAFRDARAAGFDNLNLDLIYGLPGQTATVWRETLMKALDLRPGHLSVYGLKLEAGTPLAEEVAAGRLAECGEEEQVAMWHETQRLTSAAGFERYEISNYARPGRQCRHNLAYWLNQPYLSLGAGASGYLRGERREVGSGNRTSHFTPLASQFVRYTNHDDLETYIAAVNRGNLPRAWEERQTPEQERADTVMMGLRLTAGIDRPAFQARFGRPFDSFYGEQLAKMIGDGLMGENPGSVFLTERGLLLSNYVLAEFI